MQTNMTKSIINGMKPALNTVAKSASQPFQDVFKQEQETVSRMFQVPEIASSPSFSLPKNQWHQLIILGNGFDLECGLHSKFIDFARPRLSKIDINSGSVLKNTNQFVIEHGLTVWDLILYSEPQNYWSDIESAIERWMTTRNADGQTFCAIIAYILNNQKDTFLSTGLSSDTAKTQKLVARFIRPLFDTQHIWTAPEVANILFSELNKLESAFSDYLCREVNGNEDYARNALDLLDRMLVTELPDETYNDVTASLLDFNYTYPLSGVVNPAKSYSEKRPFPTLVNIHGSLRKNNIVFGIDGTEHMDEPEALPFTKTYRLLSLDNPDMAKLIQTYSPRGIKDDSTAMIKFYGHSFAQADYAYFQAIFDGVDLYESQTKLIFSIGLGRKPMAQGYQTRKLEPI